MPPLPSVNTVPTLTPDQFREQVIPAYQPVIIRQYARDWPAVKKQQESPEALARYLQGFDQGKDIITYTGDPAIQGRFFYQEDLEGFNFERTQEPFTTAIDKILEQIDQPNPPSIYSGAVTISDHIPGFSRENRCELAGNTAIARIWMGNTAIVSAHYDMLDNIVCAVSGRRRFTLFPPEQVSNLYVGPIDFTLSGQPVSMVPLHNPDLERYPKFKTALAAAQVAELEPGDALYIPKLWWHHVESLEAFNTIVNYWWDHTGLGTDTPFATMMHALLTIKHLPEPERRAWQAFFNHYIFHLDDDPVAHIPEAKRGVLGKMTPGLYQTIKRQVLTLMTR